MLEKNKNLIGISGKKGSGKNTFARIVNTIVSNPHFTDETVLKFIDRPHNNNFSYKYKAFAEKIKVMVSLLTGYSLEELEDREIKESELGKEWWYWKLEREGGYSTKIIPFENSTTKEGFKLVKPTVRSLLQNIGTDLFRNQIHNDVWVTALFSDYNKGNAHNTIDTFDKWLITDVRFPNEMDAIQKRDGIVVRIERNFFNSTYKDAEGNNIKLSVERGFMTGHEDEILGNEHPSETALDDRTDFDYVIQNDGSLLSLVVIARHFIKQFKLLKNEENNL